KLCAEFQTESFIGGESCSLEYRQIEIADSLRPQPRIDARLVAECEVGWCCETRSFEPSQCTWVVRVAELRSSATRHRRIAPWNKVWSRTPAKQRGAVHLPVGKDQRKPALECGDAVDAPATNHFILRCANIRQILPVFAEWKIENVADHKALGNILRGQRPLSAQIVIVLNTANPGFQP